MCGLKLECVVLCVVLLYLFQVCEPLKSGEPGVCNVTVSDHRYQENDNIYIDDDWSMDSARPPPGRQRHRHRVNKQVDKKLLVNLGCCSGYSYFEDSCIPICRGNQCVNGKCTAPDTCTCDPGFELDLINTSTCIPKCAEGYKRIENSSDCQPVCANPCENGNCTQPNVCECYDGYERDPSNNFKCLLNCETGYKRRNGGTECQPVCSEPCENGYCKEPNKCECDSGFEHHPRDIYKCLSNCPVGYKRPIGSTQCQPVCDRSCENGHCARPNECECYNGHEKHPTDSFKCLPNCLVGYKRPSGSSECHPVCDESCENGHCARPNECECYNGYEKHSGDPFKCLPNCPVGYKRLIGSTECQPVCDKSCENGRCARPNECECYSGYEKHSGDPFKCLLNCPVGYKRPIGSTECQPVCDKSCENGRCARPNECECYSGYENHPHDSFKCLPNCPEGYKRLNRSVKCLPVCDRPCENGKCSMPNKCVCENNYETDPNDQFKCLPKCGNSYERLNGSSKCQPVCDQPCENGRCTKPNVCECYSGYEQDPRDQYTCLIKCSMGYERVKNSSLCQPVCDRLCENGNCTKPNECECYNGYERDTEDRFKCIPMEKIDCTKCGGECPDSEDVCKCTNGTICINYIDVPAEVARPALASINVIVISAACMALLLLVIIVIVIQRIWHKRYTYQNKPDNTGSNGAPIGSVMYHTFAPALTARPDTVEGNDYDYDSADEVGETTDTLLRRLPQPTTVPT